MGRPATRIVERTVRALRPGGQGATRSGSWNAPLNAIEGELLRAFPFPQGWPPADRPFNFFPRARAPARPAFT